MRIISGQLKGRKIVAPKSLPARATTDRAKEALFNILQTFFDFSQLEVLDLFSGTGNIAYEFASRGTQNITAIEKNQKCVSFIHKCIGHFNLIDFIHIKKDEAYRFLSKTTKCFDIIFADPPFNFTLEKYKEIVQLIFQRSLLNKDGWCIIEHESRIQLNNFDYFYERRTYGSVTFTIFKTQ